MTNAVHPPIKLFQFPRMFGIPNVSPFCCKLETWLRIARVPYEVVDTPDPRQGPKGKLPFIEDAGVRIADSSLIVGHLVKTRGVDPDAHLDASQRAIALLVQRTLEEHYAFVLAYTHFVRDEGWQHMRARFDSVPAMVRAVVGNLVRGRIKKMLWKQGVLRHSEHDIVESARRDWRAVRTVMGHGPFFFGDEPTGVDAVVFGRAGHVHADADRVADSRLPEVAACVRRVRRPDARTLFSRARNRALARWRRAAEGHGACPADRRLKSAPHRLGIMSPKKPSTPSGRSMGRFDCVSAGLWPLTRPVLIEGDRRKSTPNRQQNRYQLSHLSRQ
jgi:glutathione S-transferase